MKLSAKVRGKIKSLWPEDMFNPLQFFIMFLLVIFIVNWEHEFNHLQCAEMFGGDAIVDVGFLVFYTDIDPWPPLDWQKNFTVFAGGLGASLLCYIVWIFDSDKENRVVWRAVGLTQLLYGLTEGITFMMGVYNQLPWLGAAAMVLAAVYSFKTSKEMWEIPTFDHDHFLPDFIRNLL